MDLCAGALQLRFKQRAVEFLTAEGVLPIEILHRILSVDVSTVHRWANKCKIVGQSQVLDVL